MAEFLESLDQNKVNLFIEDLCFNEKNPIMQQEQPATLYISTYVLVTGCRTDASPIINSQGFLERKSVFCKAIVSAAQRDFDTAELKKDRNFHKSIDRNVNKLSEFSLTFLLANIWRHLRAKKAQETKKNASYVRYPLHQTQALIHRSVRYIRKQAKLLDVRKSMKEFVILSGMYPEDKTNGDLILAFRRSGFEIPLLMLFDTKGRTRSKRAMMLAWCSYTFPEEYFGL
jgi:hypothetical protein